MPQPNSYDVAVANWMVYLANALSQTVDADKIAVYRSEFRRRGVRADEIEPMFLGALDAGYQFFPGVDALLSHRPKRPDRPILPLSPHDRAEAVAARKKFMKEVSRLDESRSMLGTPSARLGGR
jgi:hypothetical protein